MASLQETIKKNPVVIGAAALMLVMFVVIAYSAFSGGSSGGSPDKKVEDLTPRTKTEYTKGAPYTTEGTDQNRKIAGVLPTSDEAKGLQRDALTNQGRYASPIDEDADVIRPLQEKKPVVVSKNDGGDFVERVEGNPELKRLWAKFNNIERGNGGLLDNEKASANHEGNGGNGEGEGSVDIPYSKFVKARLKAESTSLAADMPVVAEITDPRFPAGTQIIGAVTPNMSAYRLNAKFTRIRLADGSSAKVKANGYSIDETPGIASVVERRDIKGAVISTTFAAVKGFANAFRKDSTTTVIGLGSGTIVEQTDPAANRLREGLTGGAEEGAKKAERLMDKELDKDAYKAVIIAEKGLPILVMFTEE